MDIIGIKCGDEFYVQEERNKSYSGNNSLESYIVNGVKPEKTMNSRWSLVKGEPKSIEIVKINKDINHRYKLIHPSISSDKIPLTLLRTEAAIYDEKEHCWVFIDKYKTYSSLYELVSDKVPDSLEKIKFTYKTIMEVEEVKKFKKFFYPIEVKWNNINKGKGKITESNINNQILDRIIFPDILLPSRPSSLSPTDSYNIVRQYVKENINLKVAKITSDYDFCFTVKKVIPLSKTIEFTVDVNLFHKRRKPKYEKRYKTAREVSIFSMSPKGYRDYPTMTGFRGDNYDDLQEKIDIYCKALIDHINSPVEDCPNCRGEGVMYDKNFNIEIEK